MRKRLHAAIPHRAPVPPVVLLLLFLLLTACAGPALKETIERDPPSYALPAADRGSLAELATDFENAHGEGWSGFHLLDGSRESLDWRLALMDSAVHTLNVQTYLWYPDLSGRLLMDRAIRAADRGVQVRLIVDDLLTIGLDQAIYELERHPNIEFRLFNPWKERGLLPRAGEMLQQLERLNQRMHVKLMTVDGYAAVIGGRNIGDHYFGLSEAYNFHDLDVLGLGPVTELVEDLFDLYWNSDWVVSASNIDLEPDPEFAQEQLAAIRRELASAPELESFPRRPRNWTRELRALAKDLHPGRSLVVYDAPDPEVIAQNLARTLLPAMERAQNELLITNAYIIPDQPAIDFIRSLTDRGVRVRILTNSLESHDVPAVNSHYRPWRDDLLRAGADLYELRADAEIQSLVDVPPVAGEFVGLHTKAFVIDREIVFIGSMNFDPRSININTESGVYMHSPGLAAELAELMERDMAATNAWRVNLNEEGDLFWASDTERVDRQPARNAWQRVMDWFFKFFPKELY